MMFIELDDSLRSVVNELLSIIQNPIQTFKTHKRLPKKIQNISLDIQIYIISIEKKYFYGIIYIK